MVLSSFCPQCGAENVLGETYCPACQYPLDTTQTNEQDQITLLQGRYQLLKEIGTGGFGAVYLARDTQVRNRQVAIKQIHLQGLTSQEIIEATDAFNREAEILSTLSHPLLPQIFDRFSDPEHWYLVINFIDGLTLDEYLQQHVTRALPAYAGLSLSETLTIALQLCEVLHYLHTQQPPVIFRDLKPGNVMRTTGGQLYLIDFGIARRFKPGQIKDTIPFGSPGFAAPEQYGRAQTTPQADIYSLGALLYCLISGDDPADHPFQFPPLRLYANQGIRELDALIQRMVATDPAQRPADMLAVRAELQHIQQIQAQVSNQHIWLPPTGQTPPATFSQAGQQHILLSSTLARRKTTRRRVLTGSLIAGGVLALGGLAVYTRNNSFSHSQQSYINATADNASTTFTVQPVQPYWSSDLQHVAIFDSNKDRLEIYKYIISEKELVEISQFNSIGSVSSLQWSPDNQYIAINNNTIWDVQEESVLFDLAGQQSSQSSATTHAIAWSPNGKYIAIASSNVTFLIIDTYGAPLFSQSFSTQISTCIAWSLDSKYIIVPVADKTGNWTLQVWDIQTRQKSLTISSNPDYDDIISPVVAYGQVTGIFCSPDQRQIAFLSGYQIWLCNITEANSINNLEGYGYSSDQQPLIWSPNARYLATITDQGLLIYDVTGNYMNILTVATNLVAFAWSSDSKSITVVDNKNNRSQLSVKIP